MYFLLGISTVDNYGLSKAMHVALTSLPITIEYFIYRKLFKVLKLGIRRIYLKNKATRRKAINKATCINSFSNRISSEATVLLAVGIALIKHEDSIARLNKSI
jgi:hypothetical protein